MKRRRLLIYLLVSVLVLALTGPAALAAEPFDADKDCILIVDYRSEGEPVPGARFAIYRVADLAADLTITLSGDFTASGVELGGLTAAQFADAAEALCAYAAGAELAAHYTAATDDSGRLVLSGIPVGVYLVVGEPTVAGERKHFSDPQLVALPQEDVEGQEWDYTVTLQLKSISIGVDEELLDVTVLKKWADEGFEDKRPASVTVDLLWNGQVYDTVVLSEGNGWTHTWTDLIPIGTWEVEEKVPDGYVEELTREGNTFTITNFRKDIPQTGQLWWPVPVLTVSGLFLIVLGLLARKGRRHEA